YNTTARAEGSIAMGSETTASGDYATAMGIGTTASGLVSTAMGFGTTANAEASIAMGAETTASGDYATAMGEGTTAEGQNATAMGAETTASGNYATAMGRSTTADGPNSTAMGYSTTASGDYATAMGYNTTADGENATAMGKGTTASGENASAMGRSSTAQAYSSFVIGRYNVVSGTPDAWASTEPLFVAGNGQNAGNPSNALTLLKNGRLGLGTASPGDALEVRTNTPTTALRLKTTDSWPLRMEQTDSSFFAIYNGGQPRMTIVYNGRVGIGTTTPSSRLEVNGTVRATDFVNTSDARLKRDIRPLEDPLELIQQLRGVSYAWDRAQHPEWEPGRQLGFLAQEVAEVLPELVHEDESGYLLVNYQAMLPVLVEALKAQQRTIQAQQGEITALQEALETQGREIKALLHNFDALLAEPTTVKAASH
ncbi:MAG TPA: tail fiber domain-containing protein, partial [Rhodothermales bacterium]|nr:tail fiber domain-containing protein [Rhodothermales bacterium]